MKKYTKEYKELNNNQILKEMGEIGKQLKQLGKQLKHLESDGEK